MSNITVELLEEIADAFNRKDVDKIIDYFSEDGEFYLARGPHPHGQRFKGKAEIRQGLKDRFAAVADIQWTEGKHWVMGDKALSEFHVRGKTTAGQPIDCLGCDLWEFQDGKVLKKDTYYKQID